MTPLEAYLFLFFDSIMSAMALVSNSVMVYKLMDVFGGYDKFLMITIAVIGNSIGASINYVLGRAARSIKCTFKEHQDSARLISLSKYCNQRLFLLCFLSFWPIFGTAITMAAGFFNISYKKFFTLVMIGRALYYICL